MKEILIHATGNMVQAALVQDGELIDMVVDTAQALSAVGNVYAAIVKNILPSQFAFVDIGQEKNAFLQLDDNKQAGLFVGGKLQLKTGQTVLVQVTKDATGTKGAAVTTQISLQAPHLVVFVSDENETGVSKKIVDVAERRRLKAIVKCLCTHEGIGVILRTNSQGLSQEQLAEELVPLAAQLNKLMTVGGYTRAPALVHQMNNPLAQCLGELLDDEVTQVVTDSPQQIELVEAACKKAGSEAVVSLYRDKVPLFTARLIATQLDKALSPKVWLPSGGFLVIEQTEACVVVDVNTGKFLGTKNQQKTAYKTNIEAAVALAKQLRLRNLSGMIVVDFIHMKDQEDNDKVVSLLEKLVGQDPLPVSVLGMVHLGVVLLTRKKGRPPLRQLLTKTCPCCHGSGTIWETNA